jgi:type IV pilus assembly protein PilW
MIKNSKVPRAAGFTLIELLVAMAIGLIAVAGIASLFSGTSRTNKLQEGLARLQENGRFASMRMESDLRMAGAQYCSDYTGNRHVGVAPMWQDRAPTVFAPNLNVPDTVGPMRSVDTAGLASTANATLPYGLSSRFSMQGYTGCTAGTSCGGTSVSMFPAAGLAALNRVPNTDILTIRYLRGGGWPISGTGNCAAGGSITLAPQAGDASLTSPTPAFTSGQLALISDCGSPAIIPISAQAGNVLTVGSTLPFISPYGPICGFRGQSDIRVFNYSTNFVTVTYYLAFRTNDNPDARANNGAGAALVPTLIRRENGVEQELVRGVDRLDFRYGVRDRAGNMRFLDAAQVNSQLGGAIVCPPKPDGVAPTPGNPTIQEPGCLWRSVRRIEAFMLVNSGDEVPALDAIGRSYVYMGTAVTPAETTPVLTGGVLTHSYPRRQFIAHATHRNKTP